MIVPAADTPIAKWLADELNARGWGILTLAKRIEPDDPEPTRRALNRYIHEGAYPEAAYRKLIADALGVEADVLPVREAGRPSGRPFRGV